MKTGQAENSKKADNLPGFSYQSYLLRIWHVGYTEGNLWRASLENITTGEMLGFESLPALFTHLEAEYQQPEETEHK